MFGLFGRKNKELESIILSLEANRSNNYKDNAQSCFVDLKKCYEALLENNKLSDRQKEYYRTVIDDYEKIMEGYTHKDQTPYWT